MSAVIKVLMLSVEHGLQCVWVQGILSLRISDVIASQLRPGSLLAHRMAWSRVMGCSEIHVNSSARHCCCSEGPV